ncbi:uroporphyrinogen-III C-methyltransferase [Inhella gelatinilytica]|uniref:uroporphyrinogen-III C-methyltransferase n=1 Tax=Inhella gelatinilytica TaxID=2795030 RepID=A0A931NCQ0_9BURK|nr:uroporphyrinogen-III C-methyltransferase [Inhella gelatinilytica]MBH9552257.1 uroporphyrinogen-III C-methyltransferase [Inhella gelatinilytica]
MNTPSAVHPVALVGAGPGDPELLTVRALQRLQAADVVLADDLVDARVLALVRGRLVRVGKRGGQPSTDQAFIHGLLVREARSGRRVVRLKGGDPFVFGRGAEEVEALQAAGIPVEVVSGLTSGLAGPTAAGVSVTDRRCSPGVVLVTGHSGPGCEAPNWAALAQSGLTLVVYMGKAQCAGWTTALLAGGLGPGTPAAVVVAAHTPRQRSISTTLGELPATVAAFGADEPTLCVVGTAASRALALVNSAPRAQGHRDGLAARQIDSASERRATRASGQ